MASHDEAVADLKRKIIKYMKKEAPCYTVAEYDRGEDWFTFHRFERELDAEFSLLEKSLEQLVNEGVLVKFDEKAERYVLAKNQPYGSG